MYSCVCVCHAQENSSTCTTVMYMENKSLVMLIHVISHHQPFLVLLLTLKMSKSAQWFPKPLAYATKLAGSVLAHPYISEWR